MIYQNAIVRMEIVISKKEPAIALMDMMVTTVQSVLRYFILFFLSFSFYSKFRKKKPTKTKTKDKDKTKNH